VEGGSVSIDARVETVLIHEDGGGRLLLVDRPARAGGVPGTAGQRSLYFERAPEEVTALNGLDIWGGDGEIMLGESEIARRIGYTRIEFVDDETFKRAISERWRVE
jgi:hypothetical protein